jgi:hypothetical protein
MFLAIARPIEPRPSHPTRNKWEDMSVKIRVKEKGFQIEGEGRRKLVTLREPMFQTDEA